MVWFSYSGYVKMVWFHTREMSSNAWKLWWPPIHWILLDTVWSVSSNGYCVVHWIMCESYCTPYPMDTVWSDGYSCYWSRQCLLCNLCYANYAYNAVSAIQTMPIVHAMPFVQCTQCPLCMQCHLFCEPMPIMQTMPFMQAIQCQMCKQCHLCNIYNAINAYNAIYAHNTIFAWYTMPNVQTMPIVKHIWHWMLHIWNWIAAYLALTDSKLS